MLLRVISVALMSVLVAGCKTRTASRPLSGGRELVYTPPGTKDVQRRTETLEHAGYSKEEALHRAQAEAAQQSWGYDNANAWAYEKQREERSAAREKMQKDLAKLDLP